MALSMSNGGSSRVLGLKILQVEGRGGGGEPTPGVVWAGRLVPVVHGGDFRSPLLVVFSVCSRDLALGDFMGEIRVNPSWFFCL
jgi:hypothetical protein